MDNRQASQAHAPFIYEVTLLQLMQKEAWCCPAETAKDFLVQAVPFMAAYTFQKSLNMTHSHMNVRCQRQLPFYTRDTLTGNT